MSTVVLIRAGSTDYDDQHRILGTLDVPINTRGVEQVREIVRQLQAKSLKPECILTSPDDPANGTAYAIAEAITGADEEFLTLTWVDEAHEWQSRAIKGNQGHSRTILALTCDGGAQAQAVAVEGTVLGRRGGR